MGYQTGLVLVNATNGVYVHEQGLTMSLTKARDKALQRDIPKATLFRDFYRLIHRFDHVLPIPEYHVSGCALQPSAGLTDAEFHSYIAEVVLHAAASIGIKFVLSHFLVLQSGQRDLLETLMCHHEGTLII